MKKWYESKTLWVNFVAFLIVAAQVSFDAQIIKVEYQVGILAILNAFLRFLTNTQIGGNTNGEN